MFDGLKLSHHHHSGRIRPREYTSMIPLVILMVIVGVALSTYTGFAADHPAPRGGSIGLTGIMPGRPPAEGAKITNPIDGAHFTSTPITVSGTCPKETLVEIYKNDIFAGSTACKDDSSFSVDIDLLIDKNIISARVYDAINQVGPLSNVITVYYDVMPAQAGPVTSLSFGVADQLVINTDSAFRGIFPGQEMAVPIGIIGGAPPYAFNIQWGDLSNNVVSRSDNLTFNANHKYEKAGTYQMSIQATDSLGRISFLSVAVIVNGQVDVVASSDAASTNTTAQLFLLWPLYIAMVGMIIAFWLGQRREKNLLKKRGLVVQA